MIAIEQGLIDDIFTQVCGVVATEYDFPEIEVATLEIVSSGHDEKDDVFPMRQTDSRRIGFEFSHDRFGRFMDELDGWLNDQPISEEGLGELGLFLFIGGAAVRPVFMYEQFEKFGRGGPRKLQVVRNAYTSSKEVEEMFENIFDDGPNGEKTLVTEITDEDIMRINGLRMSMAYLHGAYCSHDATLSALESIVHNSRRAIRENVHRELPDYKQIGRNALGSRGDVIGNRICASTLPRWLIAFATPLTKESFGHIGSSLWDERFHVELGDISDSSVEPDVLIEKGNQLFLPTSRF